jgi:periplasmic protein TonB
VGVSVPVKYLALTTAALLATFLCFWAMQFLISIEISSVPDLAAIKFTTPILSTLREKEKRPVRIRAEKILPSEPPPTPEGLPTLSKDRILTQSSLPVRFSMADILGEEQIQLDMTPPIKNLFPMVVVQPVYPFVAVMKEIEGFVLVQFSVRGNGTVANAVVLESKPRSTFDDAALSAIRKFRFQPRVVGGDPMPVAAMQMRFAFSLESSHVH